MMNERRGEKKQHETLIENITDAGHLIQSMLQILSWSGGINGERSSTLLF